MLIFIKILVAVYLLAINVYSFLLICTQKNERESGEKQKTSDGKIFIAGALGGATAIYVAMFVFKYRLGSLLLMVLMPLLIAVNVYVVVTCFSQNFGVVVQTPYGVGQLVASLHTLNHV